MDRGYLAQRRRVDRGDVSGGDPPLADDAYIVFFHRVVRSVFVVRWHATIFDARCQAERKRRDGADDFPRRPILSVIPIASYRLSSTWFRCSAPCSSRAICGIAAL